MNAFRLSMFLVMLFSSPTVFGQLSDSEIPTTSSAVKPIGVGAFVPQAMAYTPDGSAVNVKDLVTSKPTILIFYRGGWCPFCNTQLGKLATIQGELQTLGYQLVAISPDAPEFLKPTADKAKAGYTLLSDSSAEAIKAFRLAYRMPDDQVEKYLNRFKLDLEQRAGGKKHHLLPVPAAYVVDATGRIRYVYSNADYTKRVDTAELLAEAQKARN